MEKDGAAPVLYAWPLIMARDDDKIVEVIGTLQDVMSASWGNVDAAVVIAVTNLFAPSPTIL